MNFILNMKLSSANKKFISIKKSNFEYIIIPQKSILSFSTKKDFCIFSLKHQTSFHCRLLKTEIEKINNSILYKDENFVDLYKNIHSEIINGNKTIFFQKEMLFIFIVSLIISFLIPITVENLTDNIRFNRNLSFFFVYVLTSVMSWSLIESKFIKDKSKIQIKHFYSNSHWMHMLLNDSIYYSVKKNFIKNIYRFKWGKYILLKDNTCIPCSDDFISKELSSIKEKNESVTLKIILHIFGFIFSFIWACLSLLVFEF